MPASFIWAGVDRRGHIAMLSAERWAKLPRAAVLLHESENGDRLWRALHAAWARDVAPRLVRKHHDLVALPEGRSPHLVAFADAPPSLPGGETIDERIVCFSHVPDELRLIVEADLEGDEEEHYSPRIEGSLALDVASFGDHAHTAFFQFDRWGDDARYRRRSGPPTLYPIVDRAVSDPRGLVALDVDFSEDTHIDIDALFGPAEMYEIGRS